MKNIIHRQSDLYSGFDINKLCSIDTGVIDSPTKPLIHQRARFLFIQEGRAVLKIQGKDYKISRHCVAMIFPWEITEVIAVDEAIQFNILKYTFDIVYMLAATLGMINKDSESMVRNLERQHVLQVSASEWQKMMIILQELEEELGLESVNVKDTPKKYSDEFCTGLLVHLLIQMNRAAAGNGTKREQGEFDKSEILRFIYLHLNEKLSIQMLAKKFYISQSSVRRYIQEMTGLTFNDLINEMRIAKTANYLLYTDFTLDELAEILGFVDASHISKIFQARVGTKISEYRKCYQKVQKICNISETRLGYTIVNFIGKNYSQSYTAQKAAAEFGISVKRLNQMLIYQVGVGFSEFLDNVRINRACELLLETKKSITDIAYEVGYSTIKTFNRKFINKKLMTPSEFRRTVNTQGNETES